MCVTINSPKFYLAFQMILKIIQGVYKEKSGTLCFEKIQFCSLSVRINPRASQNSVVKQKFYVYCVLGSMLMTEGPEVNQTARVPLLCRVNRLIRKYL